MNLFVIFVHNIHAAETKGHCNLLPATKTVELNVVTIQQWITRINQVVDLVKVKLNINVLLNSNIEKGILYYSGSVKKKS